MAEELVLIRKDLSEGAEVYDGVYAILINLDDALDDAAIQAAAVVAVNLSDQHNIPDNYFEESTIANDLITVAMQNMAGPMNDDLDALIFSDRLESNGVSF